MKSMLVLWSLATVTLCFSSLRAAAAPAPDWQSKIIGAQEAWNQGITGRGVVVAVIDSGIDFNSKTLKVRIFTNTADPVNGVDDDQNGFVDDVHGWNFVDGNKDTQDQIGHGTEMSSLVCDRGVVSGIAPNVTLLPVKFMANDGTGVISDAVKAMDYAATQGAKVILLPWGGAADSAALKAKLVELSDRGILVVTAAGNSGVDLGASPEYPAAYRMKALMTVGATTDRDYAASFSNFSSLVDLGAPGSSVLAASLQGPVWRSGTTYAAAVTAGAAALVIQKFPGLSGSQIKDRLLRFAAPMKTPFANGRLDVLAALQ